MFAVRNILSQMGWGESQRAELAKIESGDFYLTRKDRLRGARQCIYPRAMFTISKTATPFHFQIAVSRVYEEGEEAILDEDEEEAQEDHSFLIDPMLDFKITQVDDRYAFSWRDTETNDPDDRFEFVADSNMNKATRDFIDVTILQAMYERKFNRPSTGVPVAQMRALTKPVQSDDEDERPIKQESSVSQANANKGKKPRASTMSVRSINQNDEPPLVSEEAGLYLWNLDGEQFEVVELNVHATIVKHENGPFDYWIEAIQGDLSILGHQVTPGLNARWAKDILGFMWHQKGGDGTFDNWCLRFDEREAFGRFQSRFARCLWEVKNEIPWEKAIREDQEYAVAVWEGEDVEMASLSDGENESEETSEDEEDEVKDSLRADSEAPNDGGRNSNLVVGHNKDRAFVVRGNKIGVFKTGDDIQYSTTMTGLKTSKGKYFNPDKVMLHDQDKSMLVMNPNDRSTVYQLDLGERGEIVEEWKIHDDIPIEHMAPKSKFAPTTHEQTFVGASSNGLFRVDPRVSGNKLVDSEHKQYVTKAKFSSLATSQLGKVVVASAKGDFRLFDKIGKNAKTALPGMGDPIIGVDVTADSKWVVATTRTVLLVFDCTIKDGKYEGQLGFDRAFPADKKPVAKTLSLMPQHVAYMGEISFTPARFNTGPDQLENTIVTSSGPYVIAWDFSRVKKGMKDKYEIKQYADNVVADNFRFGDDSDIVVALENNVLMVDKKQLKKPTRQSLASPARTRSRK